MLWMKEASALECLRGALGIVVWIKDVFDNNFVIENAFPKYLKESCL